MWSERTGNPIDPGLLIQDAEMIYRYCHKKKQKQDSPGPKPPPVIVPSQNNFDKKEERGGAPPGKTKIIHIHTEHHHHPDKDHDCAVCGAGKPKPIIHESVDVKPDASVDSENAVAIEPAANQFDDGRTIATRRGQKSHLGPHGATGFFSHIAGSNYGGGSHIGGGQDDKESQGNDGDRSMISGRPNVVETDRLVTKHGTDANMVRMEYQDDNTQPRVQEIEDNSELDWMAKRSQSKSIL